MIHSKKSNSKTEIKLWIKHKNINQIVNQTAKHKSIHEWNSKREKKLEKNGREFEIDTRRKRIERDEGNSVVQLRSLPFTVVRRRSCWDRHSRRRREKRERAQWNELLELDEIRLGLKLEFWIIVRVEWSICILNPPKPPNLGNSKIGQISPPKPFPWFFKTHKQGFITPQAFPFPLLPSKTQLPNKA